MALRALRMGVWGIAAIAAASLTGAVCAQTAAPGAGAAGGSSVERELQGLTAQEFAERQEALRRLEALIAGQVRQRAEIQGVLDTLQKELARQQSALAVVTDEEAKARVAGLLEMERGLAGWTIRTMAEPMERRKALLAWGLTGDAAPVLAKAYAQSKRVRLDGIKALAAFGESDEKHADGAAWTLAQLINDPDGAVRAASMAAAWRGAGKEGGKAHPDIVAALWHRAVSGPQILVERGGVTRMAVPADVSDLSMKVEFPEGDPMEFSIDDDANEYTDALVAGTVLVHLKSPLVEERVKRLVAERVKAGKTLASLEDMDYTLVTHWLVETYHIKEALPVLADEALSPQTEEMNGTMNGRPFMYTQRTMAVGVLCKLIGKDPVDFGLIRGHDGDLRGWMWAVEQNPQGMNNGGQPDGAVVRAFYRWWKDHHAEYGVKEEPSAAGVPPEPRPGRGRRGGRPMPPVENGPEADGGPAAGGQGE
jgi:hypothetical protein